VRKNFLPGDELRAIGVHDELNSTVTQIVVDFGVMDHLTEEEDASAGIFIKCPVTDFDGVFYAVAKSEVTSEIKCYGSEIQTAGREILLAGIPHSANLLNPARNGSPVINRNIKLLDGAPLFS